MKLLNAGLFTSLTTASLFVGVYLAGYIMDNSWLESFAIYWLLAPVIALAVMVVLKRLIFKNMRNGILIMGFGINMIIVIIADIYVSLIPSETDMMKLKAIFALMVAVPSFLLSFVAFGFLKWRDEVSQ